MANAISWYKGSLACFWVAGLCLLATSGCSEDEEIDTEYPEIDLNFVDAFPAQCSTIKKGETFTFQARFNDNVQLGSFSLDIHHNFDHHTHSTEVNDCDLDPVKAPVKPFLLIENFGLPDGVRQYEANVEISVPENVDGGDYHFMIRLTDKEGWQSIKGLSVRIE